MYKGYDFKFTKSLGQNFLKDEGVIMQILEGAGIGPDTLVLEIGPGMGALTKPAAAMSRKVVAIEIDSSLIPILSKELANAGNVRIINEDVLKADIKAIIESERQADPLISDTVIIGNLPYYITTPIIMKLLEENTGAGSITIMMQKEVADRIVAKEGGKEYGSLSIAVGYHCQVSPILNVPRSMFFPEPKVDSTVLRLDIRKEKAASPLDEKLFFDCVRAAFSHRRKTLVNCLAGFKGLSKETMGRIIETSGISPQARAETLSIEEFSRLSDNIKGAI